MQKQIAFGALSAAAIAAALAAAAPARAQQAGSALADPEASTSQANSIDEVVVTARRVEENLQTVPVSVTAVSTERMRQQQITEITGLQRVSPSFTVTRSTRGGSSPAVMIRGQRGFSANTLADPAVTVYFADVGQSVAGGLGASMYDLQSVQVLKGPQGTLFGRNTTGGAVLITPNAPTTTFDGYGQVSLGNHDYRDAEGMVNLPISDKLSIRAAGKVTRRDGYLRNVVRGGRAENLHSDSARLSVLFKPTDAIESTTIGTYYSDDTINASKLFAIAPSRLVLPAVSLPIATAALARNNAYGKYDFEDNAPQVSRTRVGGIQNTTRIDFDTGLDELAIKNIAGYRRVKTFTVFDLDGSAMQTILQTTRLDAKVFSDEFQVIGRSGNLSFIGGLFYYQLNAYDNSYSNQFADLAVAVPAAFPSVNYADLDTRNRSYAAFAHIDYKLDSLLEGLSVAAGFRYTKDVRKLTYHNRSSAGFTPTVWRCTLNGATIPDDRELCAVAAPDATFKEPTYDVTLSWQASPQLLLYGAYRHGYRSGGFNNSPPSALAITVFRPEKVDDFELGLKTDFRVGGMAGRFNLAAYYDKLIGAQRTINGFVQSAPPPAPPAFVALVVNAGRGRTLGGEAELTLLPTDRLTLSVNGAVIDTGYDRFNDSYLVGGVPTAVDISDSSYAYAPKYQLNASVRYELPIPESAGKLALQASYYYQSSIQTAEINTANCGPNGLYPNCINRDAKVKGYSIGNLRADWRNVGGANVDLAFFVNNVTNKFYKVSSINALGLVGVAPFIFGEPRMFGVELRVPFGASAY